MSSGSHQFDPSILREYDIRGLVGDTLNEADLEAVGRAFGTMVARRGGRTVAIGYDGRLSSPDFEAAAVAGLVAVGMTVHRVGRGPTPMQYFAIKHLGCDAGVMITGSHNPPEYNGIKMTWADGPVYGDAIQEVGRIAAAGDYASGTGSAQWTAVDDAYVDRLVAAHTGPRPLKVAWDAGNGAAGEILQRMAERLPGEHILLFADIDGTFPNHHPDPTVPENLTTLIETVRREGCDMGIGFDGDGDRIGAVDDQGRVLWGDQLVAIYAADVLSEHPGAMVIADVKSSKTLFDEIARLGGQPMMWKTGHSLLKAKMAETGAPLAGEMSGHIFFGENHGFDDALYGGIRLMNLVAKQDGTLSHIRDQLPAVLNTPEIRFQVDETRKFKVIEEISGRLAAAGADVVDLDGVRVNTADGWWLLRASNTQDVLVARAESATADGLERLKALLSEQLQASGLPAPDFASGGH